MKNQKLYTSTAVQDLVSRYFDDKNSEPELFQIEEGGLGWGFCILYDWSGHLKTYIINEVFINCWSSGHTVRGYNKIPKKYLKMIEEYEYED